MMHYKKLCMRIISSGLLIMFVFSYNLTAFSVEDNSRKDENVYVNLNYNGSIKDTIVVNSFKVKGNSKVLDYGNYTNIKNLSSTAKPKLNNGFIEWDVDKNADSFYYQGELGNINLPWNFNITYKLDGKEVSGDKLIGANGNLEIKIDVKANDDVNKYFSDNYMAQIASSFDMEKCKNILAPDAMMSTLGSKRQATFMVLPKANKTYYINTTVSDFESDGITIAMIKVSDGIIGKMDGLKLGLSDVSSGVSQLMDGTGQLKNGATDLTTAISLINNGAASISQVTPIITTGMSEFNNGLSTISDGMSQLNSGSTQIRSGLSELDSNSYALSKGLGQVQSGLKEMAEKKDAIVSGLSELEKNKDSLSQISQGGNTLMDGYGQIDQGLQSMIDAKGPLDDAIEELNANKPDASALVTGVTSLKSGIDSLNAANEKQLAIINGLLSAANQDPNLAKYAQQLGTMKYIAGSMQTGFSSASSGAGQLQTGASSAVSGVNQLYGAATSFGSIAEQTLEGASKLHTNMALLNNGLKTYCDGANNLTNLYSAADTFGNSALKLVEGAESLNNGMEELTSAFDKYAEGVNTVATNYITLDNALNDAENGSASLKSNYETLMNASDSIFSSVNELADSINKLDSSASKLPGSIDTLANGGNQLINGITSSGGDVGSLIEMSDNAEPVSFVAPNIVTPNSVQFVIKTPDFNKPDVKNNEQAKEKLNILQKLIQLFKGKGK